MAGGSSGSSNTLTERLLRQNAELTGFVSRLTEEKNDLRNHALRLEEELRRYRQAGQGSGDGVSALQEKKHVCFCLCEYDGLLPAVLQMNAVLKLMRQHELNHVLYFSAVRLERSVKNRVGRFAAFSGEGSLESREGPPGESFTSGSVQGGPTQGRNKVRHSARDKRAGSRQSCPEG